MKSSLFVVVCLVWSVFCASADAQSKGRRNPANQKRVAVVVDERLAVVRAQPSLLSRSIRRVRRGRVFSVGEFRSADGVVFHRVTLSSRASGWLQAEAFVVRGKPGEDVRLFRLVSASKGFEQVDRARIFLEVFPDSALRPAMLLLLGDLMEETAAKISKDLAKRLRKAEMSASGAPVYSFYLSSATLDRYLKLGLGFIFDESSMRLHYDGRAWQEIVKKFPSRPEAEEARKRLDAAGDWLQVVGDR